MLQGFDSVVWTVVLLNSCGGLLVAAVMKYADNIVKCFAAALAILSGTLISVPLFHFHPSRLFAVGGLCTISATMLYSWAPTQWPEGWTRAGRKQASLELEPLDDQERQHTASSSQTMHTRNIQIHIHIHIHMQLHMQLHMHMHMHMQACAR